MAEQRATVYKTVKKAHIRQKEKRVMQEVSCSMLQKWKDRLIIDVKEDTYLNKFMSRTQSKLNFSSYSGT